MKKSTFNFIYILIAFLSLIEHNHGQIHMNVGSILGFTQTDETVITIQSGENENDKDLTHENENIFTDIKASSHPKENPNIAGNIDTTKDIPTIQSQSSNALSETKSKITISNSFSEDNMDIIFSDVEEKDESDTFNVQTTEIKNTNKPVVTTELTKSSFLENTDDKNISTYINPGIEISDTINHSSRIIDIIKKSFNENSISTDYNIFESNPSSEKENNNNIKTTEYEFKTDIDNIPISTDKIFSTNQNTYLNFNNSFNLSTILTTSTNQLNDEKIPTTIFKINNSTIIIDNTIKTTEIIYKDTSLILLGFSHYNKSDSYFSFYTYFGILEGYIYSNNLKFSIQITYNTNLRLLENYEANCNLKNISNLKISYLCEIQTETQNINNIKIIPQFNFILQTPSVVISPIANIYINNIQNLQNQLDINSNLYILRNSKINKGENKIFNISGIINEPLPKFQKVDLVLTVNIENENKETDINCNVIDINNINYIIQCKVNDNKNYTLQNGISIIGDEILLINFDDNKTSVITFYSSENTKKDDPTNTVGLGAGSVIAILVILTFFGYFI